MDDRLAGLREWLCPNGHVLGLVKRAHEDAAHVSRLLLFRHAVDRSAPVPVAVDVIATLEGQSYNIRCDVDGCGSVRSWHWGKDAQERFAQLLQEQPRRAWTPDTTGE